MPRLALLAIYYVFVVAITDTLSDPSPDPYYPVFLILPTLRLGLARAVG